jgi:pimeloyl-[acyl-carrier protein] methyl ester esterase
MQNDMQSQAGVVIPKVAKPKLVLLHGWGLNRHIWDDLVPQLSAFDVTLLDLPGYGARANETMPSSIDEVTELCLEQAPDKAIWLGWSLGGMVAIQAAAWDSQRTKLGQKERVSALCLVNTTPCFAEAEDWSHGVSVENMQAFAEQLANDYRKTLNGFLLLQAGGTPSARKIAKFASQRISQLATPSKATLMAGIDCLRTTDLRESLSNITLPCHVISGRLDRIIKPSASDYLAAQLNAEHLQFNEGHSPFLTQPTEFCQALTQFAHSL